MYCNASQLCYNFGITFFLILSEKDVEASIWLMLGVLSSFIFVIELGFTPTIQRFSSYSINKDLKISNLNNFKFSLTELYFNAKSVYFFLSIISCLIIYFSGEIILNNLFEISSNFSDNKLLFLLFIIKIFFYCNSIGLNAILQGVGKMSISKSVEGNIFLIKFLISIIFLLLGYSLSVVVLIDLLLTIIWFLYLSRLLLRYLNLKLIDFFNFDLKLNFIKNIFPTSLKWGGMQFGGYLINYSSSVAVSQLSDPLIISSFLLTTRAINVIRLFSSAPILAEMPNYFMLFSKNDLKSIKYKLLSQINKPFYLFFSATSIILVISFALEYNLLSFNNFILEPKLLIMLILMGFLELNHGLNAQIYMGSNHIPFLFPGIISGLLILFLQLEFASFGVVYIILIQAIVQACCNNWFPVYLNFNKLDINFITYIKALFKFPKSILK